MSVQEYARTWLEIYKHDTELNTKAMYHRVIDVHMDVLKSVPISSIRKTNVLMCLNAASGKVKTQEQILLTLKQVVKAAATDKHIAPGIYLEIFDGIRIKKQKNTDKRPLTPEEREAVFSADFTNMQKAFVYIIYGCGLRRGEALALERSDFDFEKKKPSISNPLPLTKIHPISSPRRARTASGKSRYPQMCFLFYRNIVNACNSPDYFILLAKIS